MRGQNFGTDMDFRVIPSCIPLQSPSPDRKSINLMAPTLSPNSYDIRKNTTPMKTKHMNKEQRKQNYQSSTDFKYQTHTPKSDYLTVLEQKEEMIKKLKGIINCMADSNKNSDEEDQLHSQIKILTIENQKLVSIIEKIGKNQSDKQGTSKINEQYQIKISELMRTINENQKIIKQNQMTIKENQQFYSEQAKQLKRFNKSLNAHCKNLEQEKNQLAKENQQLLKILRQKNQTEKKGNSLKLSDASNNSNEDKNQNSTKNQDRLTLMKIREQHSQNLKMLKDGLIKQIQQTFDTMKIALDGINAKVLGLSKRLESLETLTWDRVKKTQIETQSITISIRQGIINEPEPETSRSFNLDKKNSEIYIEQGPSSSHQKASRDEFSRLEEVSSQKNLHNNNILLEELKNVKLELQDLKIKHEKTLQQTCSLVQSHKAHIEADETQRNQKLRQSAKEEEKLKKQIDILYEQIRSIEYENSLQNMKKDAMIREKQNQIQKIKQIHQQNINDLQTQTESKVKLLLSNYEKQIQMLQKQIKSKDNSLSESSSSLNELSSSLKELKSENKNQKDESQRKISHLSSRVNQLETQRTNLQEKIKILSTQLHDCEENWRQVQKNKDRELQFSYQNAEKNRKKWQSIEQETMLTISELNQKKLQVQNLKTNLSQTKQQLFSQQQVQNQNNNKLQLCQQTILTLNNLLSDKQNIIIRLRQILLETADNDILREIEQIGQSLKNNNALSSQQESRIKQIMQTNCEHLKSLQAQNKSLLWTQQQQLQEIKTQSLKIQSLSAQIESLSTQLLQQQKQALQKNQQILQKQQEIREKQDAIGRALGDNAHLNQQIARFRAGEACRDIGDDLVGKLENVKKMEIQRRERIKRLLESKE